MIKVVNLLARNIHDIAFDDVVEFCKQKVCDFPHNLTSFLKHKLATQDHHTYFQRKQAVNALKDILTASLICEA